MICYCCRSASNQMISSEAAAAAAEFHWHKANNWKGNSNDALPHRREWCTKSIESKLLTSAKKRYGTRGTVRAFVPSKCVEEKGTSWTRANGAINSTDVSTAYFFFYIRQEQYESRVERHSTWNERDWSHDTTSLWDDVVSLSLSPLLDVLVQINKERRK